MGWSRFLYLPDPNADAISALQNRLTNVHRGRLAGPWLVTCRLFVDNDSTKALYLVIPSTQPMLAYSCIISTSEASVIKADKSLEQILSRLKVVWLARQSIRTEGFIYSFADYEIRLGTVMAGGVARGITVEVFLNFIPESDDEGEEYIRNLMQKLFSDVPLFKDVDTKTLDLRQKNEKVNFGDDCTPDMHAAYEFIRLLRKHRILTVLFS
ncbi:hypothetical protein BC829DRAFT_404701 [Chytridium lagenaria]|nr:hypothetical protein BC829DRAFT_404701 [Chytridium lagenaria]